MQQVSNAQRLGGKLHELGEFSSYTHAISDPRRVALLVVDMQTALVERGYPNQNDYITGVAPKIAELMGVVRRAGGTVAWTRHTWEDSAGRALPGWFEAWLGPDGVTGWHLMVKDSVAHSLSDRLKVEPDDIVVDKYRISAFVPDCGLDGQLRARGIDTLIVAGCLTNFCCQSAARDAFMLDYRVIMPPDATATRSDSEHNKTFEDLSGMGFFDLRRSTKLADELEPADARRTAATQT